MQLTIKQNNLTLTSFIELMTATRIFNNLTIELGIVTTEPSFPNQLFPFSTILPELTLFKEKKELQVRNSKFQTLFPLKRVNSGKMVEEGNNWFGGARFYDCDVLKSRSRKHA